MHILQVTPAGRDSRSGNRTTADRWEAILEELGHRVTVRTDYVAGDYDAMIALHAWKSAEAIARFRADHPDRLLVVALTGTDLYRDLDLHPEALRSLELADALVALHDLAHRAIPARFHERLHVIFQSVEPIATVDPRDDIFEVCVAAHLRDVKDPLRSAYALRDLPVASQLHVTHAGKAMDEEWRALAEREVAENDRYTWAGELPRDDVLLLIARSRALVLTSLLEGGANVVGEAIVAGTPVISSRIDGSEGLLGVDYPGFFPVGDTDALRALLTRFETDDAFRRELQERSAAVRPKFDRSKELEAWRAVLR